MKEDRESTAAAHISWENILGSCDAPLTFVSFEGERRPIWQGKVAFGLEAGSGQAV